MLQPCLSPHQAGLLLQLEQLACRHCAWVLLLSGCHHEEYRGLQVVRHAQLHHAPEDR